MTSMHWNAPYEPGVVSIMEASQEYRQLAEECDRLAQQAETEEQCRTLRKMAAAWRKVAEEYDREHLARAH